MQHKLLDQNKLGRSGEGGKSAVGYMGQLENTGAVYSGLGIWQI